jgi:hypothetical protein
MTLRHLLALIVLTMAPALALAQQAPQPPPVPAPERHAPTSLAFPPHIDQAEKYASTDYAKTMNRPDLGYAWNYRVPGLTVATIYLYSLGNASIPSGDDNPLVLAQFRQAYSDIQVMAKSNRYDELKLMKEPADCRVASVVFRCLTLAAIRSADKVRVATALMVTGYRNSFLKLRIDWQAGVPAAEAAVGGFVNAFAATMR